MHKGNQCAGDHQYVTFMVPYVATGSNLTSPAQAQTFTRMPMLLSLLQGASSFGAPTSTKGSPLNHQILNAIEEEILRLRQARAILTKSQATPRSKTSAAKNKPRRALSAKARRAIADAQRKRWANVRRQKKPASPVVEMTKESAAS
jgi:hypothetical protein